MILMFIRLVTLCSLLLAPILSTYGQELMSLNYSSKLVIAHGTELDGSIIGGISGITYNPSDGFLYMVADKPPARLFKVSFNNEVPPAIKFENSIELSPAPLKKSELEGITYISKTSGYYVSDEQKEGTRILELSKNAELVKIIEPKNEAFLPLSGHNSGIEGLAINENESVMYYSFERPTQDCQAKGLVEIRKLNLTESELEGAYYHKLHKVNGDIIKTNGISEILYVDETSLLIMERAYIPGIGNIVRLFLAKTEDQLFYPSGNQCEDDIIKPLSAKLLFDFVNVSEVKIDNAEGMAFNADRSKLYIVSDNNFSKKQETQIIVLDAKWK